MKRFAFLVFTAGVMATTVSPAAAGLVPISYSFNYPPPPASGYPVVPDLLGRAAEILGAIRDSQERTMLAEEWLSFTKELIKEELKYRAQWLELQKRQMDQALQVEQLRLEVARLQQQIEQLRAGKAQPQSPPPTPSAPPPATPPPTS
jgi:hypothetical protein